MSETARNLSTVQKAYLKIITIILVQGTSGCSLSVLTVTQDYFIPASITARERERKNLQEGKWDWIETASSNSELERVRTRKVIKTCKLWIVRRRKNSLKKEGRKKFWESGKETFDSPYLSISFLHITHRVEHLNKVTGLGFLLKYLFPLNSIFFEPRTWKEEGESLVNFFLWFLYGTVFWFPILSSPFCCWKFQREV